MKRRNMSNLNPKPGKLYGIGVGPGDPELLTLKARRVLEEVPVIFAPRKSPDEPGMAEGIITGLLPELKNKCAGVILPMLKDEALLQPYWRQAALQIQQRLSKGGNGAFINIGDPLLYGTFIYIWDILRREYPETEVEIIPGISSINAAGAKAQVPLAIDDDNIAIISGDQKAEMIKSALASFDTVIFMKVNTVFNKLFKILEETQLIDRGVFIKRCTTGKEEIVRDIRALKENKLDYFSLLIVRKQSGG